MSEKCKLGFHEFEKVDEYGSRCRICGKYRSDVFRLHPKSTKM